MRKSFILKGTPKEQAYQLVDAIKNKKVSGRNLKEIFPLNKEFFQGLVDCLKKESDNEHTENKIVLETIIKNIEYNQSLLRDHDMDKEEKQDIRNKISEDLQKLSDIHNKNGERRHNRFLAILSLIGIIIAILKGNNKGNFPYFNKPHTI